jgi:hypothetical protein
MAKLPLDIRFADDPIEAAGPIRRLIADRGANRLRRAPSVNRDNTSHSRTPVRANVRSITMSDATAIAGGSKLLFVA